MTSLDPALDAFNAWQSARNPREYPAERQAFYAGWLAAMQSQDREDALRYRALVASGHFVPAPRPCFSIWGLRTTEGKATKAELDEAIDHARRVEGEAKP